MNTESISITPNRKCGGITNQSISLEYDNPTTSFNQMMIKQKPLQYEDNYDNHNHSNSDDYPQIHIDDDDDENDTDIYRIVRTKMISPPPPLPPPPLPQQLLEHHQHDGNNTPHSKPYHHHHPNTFSSSPNRMIRKKESLSYSPQQYGCSTSPLIPKSIMTAWTPATTATTATTHNTMTMTPLLPTTTTTTNAANQPLPLFTPPLTSLCHFNNRNHHHHHHSEEEELEFDDDDHDCTESAIQFVERTTNEMHEIVQYWLLQSSSYDDDESLQQQQQQPLYHDDDPIRIDVTSTTTKQQQPKQINENNTLWHLSKEEEEEVEDRVDIYHGKNDDLVVDENVLDVKWPITNDPTNEPLSLLLFETLSTRTNKNRNITHIPNEDITGRQYDDSDFDTCVEDFFTQIEECQGNMQRPTQHKYRNPTRTTGTNQFCSSNDDDDDNYYHDTNEELNDWANILYSSTSPSVNRSVGVKEQLSLQPPTLLTKWIHYPQQQPPRKYHPLIMAHYRTKMKSNIPTKSFWQWIDQQMNHDDVLQQQQFHRRIWNLVFLSITLLMLLSLLLVVVLLVRQSILYVDSYRGFIPNVNDIPIVTVGSILVPTNTSTCVA